jgi:hypothetical protein
MKLKIKKAELVPDKFGQHIKVTMIGLYDENDKWIRWVKLNDALIKELLEAEINIETK